jgi:hypothetical protein
MAAMDTRYSYLGEGLYLDLEEDFEDDEPTQEHIYTELELFAAGRDHDER